MEPARSIIERLGGHAVVAAGLGISTTRVYYFTYPKAKGGTDGLIPQKHWPALFRLAKDRGVSLSADDLYPTEAAA